jgi:hypothetical protein
MPTLSFFHGILIQMYWDDHPPPHFHARYAEYVASFEIENLCRLAGTFPPAQEKLVLAWARLHQDELREDWKLCRREVPPFKIAPLP